MLKKKKTSTETKQNCPKCGAVHSRSGRYCLTCHAAYMSTWRHTHRLTTEQRRKANCRSYANVYQRRGKITQIPCEVCNEPESQMHHPDYSKPLVIRWLCRSHHLELHRNEHV